MKPLISYYGGKQKMVPHIVPLLAKIPHSVYVEPFFGGGAIFYGRPHYQPGDKNDYRECINDHSGLLINLYRVARSHPDEFFRLIEWTPYARAEYEKAIEFCKTPDNHSELDLAWAYYVNINMGFANKLDAGWGVGLISRNLASTWRSRKRHILPALERLERVHIECRDAIDVIKQWSSPHALFYLDPPYPGTECGHYDGYTMEDWEMLCATLDSIDGSYVLSNFSQEIEPQSAQQRIEVSRLMSAAGKGKVGVDKSLEADERGMGERDRTEVLWVCDRSSKIRKSLQGASKSSQLSLL